MFSIEELRDSLNSVCLYTSISKKEIEALMPYMISDEKPLMLFQGTDKSGNTKKIVLTNKNFFFVTSGIFSSAKVDKLPNNLVSNIIEHRGMLLADVDIVLQNPPSVMTFKNVLKEVSSKLVTTWSTLRENISKAAASSEKLSSEKIGRLESLFALKEKGTISEEEYNQEKNKLLNTNTNDDAVKKVVMNSSSSQKYGKEKKSKLGVYVLAFIIAAAIFSKINKDDTKDSAQLKDTQSQIKTTSQSKGNVDKTTVNLNTDKIIKPSRQKYSKAFIKTNGTKIFKESDLKNSLGELMRGTEVRIQEGMSSSGNLPVRYKVNVMKAGKVDITGWLIGDTLSDPVNLNTQQIDNKKFFSLKEFLYRFNKMASTLGSGHNLSKQNMKFTSGSVKDSYSIVS